MTQCTVAKGQMPRATLHLVIHKAFGLGQQCIGSSLAPRGPEVIILMYEIVVYYPTQQNACNSNAKYMLRVSLDLENNSIQIFHTFLCNSQNYHTQGAVDDPKALLHEAKGRGQQCIGSSTAPRNLQRVIKSAMLMHIQFVYKGRPWQMGLLNSQ